MKKILMVAALAAMGAGAAPVVEITSVQQQYPWTNTVDITYTSTGIESNNTYFVVFKAQDSAGKELDVITNDLKISQGSTWVAQWQPPFNVRYENCTMTPYVYKGGQDDYMIVDLKTWAVTYEGMSVQNASNAKYDTNEYKTNKLVLRKVQEGEYTIGHDEMLKPADAYAGDSNRSYCNGTNSQHKVQVPAGTCYYIGIFEVTQAQYGRIMGTDTSSTNINCQTTLSYNTLRNSAGAASTLAGDPKNTTSFFVRLNGLTGKTFDLPTEEMWEIAARAGTTTRFYWGDAPNAAYWSATPVGQALPNAWGIYDMAGTQSNMCRDIANYADLKTKTSNIYTPISSGSASYTCLRGGNSGDLGNGRIAGCTHAARRLDCTLSSAQAYISFRASIIVQ